MDKFTILGDKVLIQLDPKPEDTTTDKGVIVPHYVAEETDGGRPTVRLSGRRYLSVGTVVQVSPLASQKLQEASTPLSPNDRVFISLHALSPNYQFFSDRTNHVINHTGLMLIPYNLIEAKLHG